MPFDFDSPADGIAGDTSELGCGSHLILFCLLLLVVIGLFVWLG